MTVITSTQLVFSTFLPFLSRLPPDVLQARLESEIGLSLKNLPPSAGPLPPNAGPLAGATIVTLPTHVHASTAQNSTLGTRFHVTKPESTFGYGFVSLISGQLQNKTQLCLRFERDVSNQSSARPEAYPHLRSLHPLSIHEVRQGRIPADIPSNEVAYSTTELLTINETAEARNLCVEIEGTQTESVLLEWPLRWKLPMGDYRLFQFVEGAEAFTHTLLYGGAAACYRECAGNGPCASIISQKCVDEACSLIFTNSCECHQEWIGSYCQNPNGDRVSRHENLLSASNSIVFVSLITLAIWGKRSAEGIWEDLLKSRQTEDSKIRLPSSPPPSATLLEVVDIRHTEDSNSEDAFGGLVDAKEARSRRRKDESFTDLTTGSTPGDIPSDLSKATRTSFCGVKLWHHSGGWHLANGWRRAQRLANRCFTGWSAAARRPHLSSRLTDYLLFCLPRQLPRIPAGTLLYTLVLDKRLSLVSFAMFGMIYSLQTFYLSSSYHECECSGICRLPGRRDVYSSPPWGFPIDAAEPHTATNHIVQLLLYHQLDFVQSSQNLVLPFYPNSSRAVPRTTSSSEGSDSGLYIGSTVLENFGPAPVEHQMARARFGTIFPFHSPQNSESGPPRNFDEITHRPEGLESGVQNALDLSAELEASATGSRHVARGHISKKSKERLLSVGSRPLLHPQHSIGQAADRRVLVEELSGEASPIVSQALSWKPHYPPTLWLRATKRLHSTLLVYRGSFSSSYLIQNRLQWVQHQFDDFRAAAVQLLSLISTGILQIPILVIPALIIYPIVLEAPTPATVGAVIGKACVQILLMGLVTLVVRVLFGLKASGLRKSLGKFVAKPQGLFVVAPIHFYSTWRVWILCSQQNTSRINYYWFWHSIWHLLVLTTPITVLYTFFNY